MPVSVVVGGQFGSEGKGKVALHLARTSRKVDLIIRPGGTNSGHTAYSKAGDKFVLRQLPAACLDGGSIVVFPSGSYIDVDLLEEEIERVGLSRDLVKVDYRSHIIRPEHVDWEKRAELQRSIGSTESGTGASVLSRVARGRGSLPQSLRASECSSLRPYLDDTAELMRKALDQGARALIEGTQGFGLSILHSDNWPKTTSRDTTASGFVSEAGLSPFDVDEIVLVLRALPIRVAGNSGPLKSEMTWRDVAQRSQGPWARGELTSVTQRLRRVGEFDSEIARRAISMNRPTSIVINHLDQIDYEVHGSQRLTTKCRNFLKQVEEDLGRRIDMVGTGPEDIFAAEALLHA